jgi:hypothetical protein
MSRTSSKSFWCLAIAQGPPPGSTEELRCQEALSLYRSTSADFDAFGHLDLNLNLNDFDPVLGHNTKPGF